MKNLNSIQKAKIKELLLRATFKCINIVKFRDRMSSSDGNIKVKEIILEGIDSIMNRDRLTNIATVCDGDMKFDEE